MSVMMIKNMTTMKNDAMDNQITRGGIGSFLFVFASVFLGGFGMKSIENRKISGATAYIRKAVRQSGIPIQAANGGVITPPMCDTEND